LNKYLEGKRERGEKRPVSRPLRKDSQLEKMPTMIGKLSLWPKKQGRERGEKPGCGKKALPSPGGDIHIPEKRTITTTASPLLAFRPHTAVPHLRGKEGR